MQDSWAQFEAGLLLNPPFFSPSLCPLAPSQSRSFGTGEVEILFVYKTSGLFSSIEKEFLEFAFGLK
jgi:hypothetical protein